MKLLFHPMAESEEIMRRLGLFFLSSAVIFLGFGFDSLAQTVKTGAVVPLTGRYAAPPDCR